MDRKKPASNGAVLQKLRDLGFPEVFCLGVVYVLDTDTLSDKMLHFLQNTQPTSQEIVADEVVSIVEDRYKYMQK